MRKLSDPQTGNSCSSAPATQKKWVMMLFELYLKLFVYNNIFNFEYSIQYLNVLLSYN